MKEIRPLVYFQLKFNYISKMPNKNSFKIENWTEVKLCAKVLLKYKEKRRYSKNNNLSVGKFLNELQN